MQENCYKDNLGPKIEETCYKNNVRPKSQESDTASIHDEAKLGSSYRHRPKGDVHIDKIYITNIILILINIVSVVIIFLKKQIEIM